MGGDEDFRLLEALEEQDLRKLNILTLPIVMMVSGNNIQEVKKLNREGRERERKRDI